MIFKTRSGAVYGIDASPVEVEVNIATRGNGEFQIVGLPDSAIRESRPRIRSAIRNSGFRFPHEQITVNLAPANLRKEGSAFDLPMAIGILGGTGLIQPDLSDCVFVGELSLDGRLRPIRGVLSIAMLARKMGISKLIVPDGNATEAAVVDGVSIYPIKTLTEAVDLANGSDQREPLAVNASDLLAHSTSNGKDYRDVRGQQDAKRAIEVAIAGGHNINVLGTVPGTDSS